MHGLVNSSNEAKLRSHHIVTNNPDRSKDPNNATSDSDIELAVSWMRSEEAQADVRRTNSVIIQLSNIPNYVRKGFRYG